MRVRYFAFVILLMTSAAAQAQERQTEHTLKLAEGSKPDAATIAQMEWLAGHWKGEGLGGECEEMWTPPVNGTMLGSFRFMRDGNPVFYEILTLSERDGSLVFRLKHFNPDLVGWEEKDGFVEFRFVGERDGVIHFEGMSFHREGENLTVYLAIENDGQIQEEVFRYTRVK